MNFIKYLNGGRRNQTSLHQVGADLVVKKSFGKKDGFDFYVCERDTLLSLAHSGFTAKVVDWNDEERFLVYNYLEGESLEVVGSDCNVQRLGAILAELHNTTWGKYKGSFSFYRDPNTDLRDIKGFISESGLTLTEDEVISLDRYFEEYSKQESPIHGTLIPSNVIVAGQDFHLLDFEMGSLNSPFVDLGYLATYITSEQRKQLKEGYALETGKSHTEYDEGLNYGRFHISALTLLLYLRQEQDQVLKGRSATIKGFLQTPVSGSLTERSLLELYQRIELEER